MPQANDIQDDSYHEPCHDRDIEQVQQKVSSINSSLGSTINKGVFITQKCYIFLVDNVILI